MCLKPVFYWFDWQTCVLVYTSNNMIRMFCLWTMCVADTHDLRDLEDKSVCASYGWWFIPEMTWFVSAFACETCTCLKQMTWFVCSCLWIMCVPIPSVFYGLGDKTVCACLMWLNIREITWFVCFACESCMCLKQVFYSAWLKNLYVPRMLVYS